MSNQQPILPLLLVVAASFAAAGCSQPRDQTPDVESRPADDAGRGTKPGDADVPLVVKGNNEFAFDLYASLSAEQSGNLFFSPASVSTALAMTYAGARGETAEQMAEVLHFGIPHERLHPAFASLIGELRREGSGYHLLMANRLWGQHDFGFLPEFQGINQDHYGAELGRLDFKANTEAARGTINDWVAKHTADKIENLITSGMLGKLTRLVLVNAIYFKSEWANQFTRRMTEDAPFQVSAREKVTVPMMGQQDPFKYAAMKDLQILELPYAEHDLSMIVLLPKAVDGLRELETRLTTANLNRWLTGLKRQEVGVYLPRFKMTSAFQLNDALSSLGMKLLFSIEEADLSGMTDESALFVSAVVHEAWVDVDEDGTEAAAATAVIARSSESVPPPEPIPVFRADHPFVFLVRHNQTGSILFLGRLVNPGQS